MNRFSIRLGLVLAALSLLTTAASAGERPIKGGGSGVLEYNGSRLVASGHVRHLGNSSVLIYIEQNSLDFGEVRPQFCVFTAANGDLLAAAVVDGFFDIETGVLVATLSFRAVPDGRFADAEGTVNLLIVFDDWAGTGPYEGSFNFVLGGTIDY